MAVMKKLVIGGITYDTVGEASVTQVLPSGEKIATVNIDGTSTDLYAPQGGGVSVTATTCTLAANGWSNNSQTVNVSGVTASNIVLVTYAPSSKDDYVAADVTCTAQGSGTLTFTCSETPSATITVNVMIIDA